MLDENKLKQYMAKTDNKTTLYKHNRDLLNILYQIQDIYNLSKKEIKSLEKICLYHDLGKIYTISQNKMYDLRHEFIGSSMNDLNYEEIISILTHHKNLDQIRERLLQDKQEYYKAKQYIEKQLNIKLNDLYDFQKQNLKLFHSMSAKNLHNLDLLFKKGYLNLCDHIASSGISKIDKGIDTYNTFKNSFNNKFNSIQKQVLKLKKDKDIIIIAPTGFGKSATSLLWTHINQNEIYSKRIYYILPYTTSINSLYNSFSKDFNFSTGMLHSKAEYFLSKETEDYKSKYQTFKKSIKQITICTIFQIIKAFFSSKNYEMLLSQLRNSLFIIDEIHCFNIREFCFIIETLKYLKDNFHIRICIMSASISTCMSNIIKNKLDIKNIITPFEDNSEKNLYKLKSRHKIILHDNYLFKDMEFIKQQIIKGKKVLICVNKIEKAQKIYNELKKTRNKRLIHGRFNMRDRERIEKGLDDCKVLIGTQAIEVSLDIDYDIMYTEIAPFDSLLQRFGRVNRKGLKGIAEIHIYEEENSFYNKTIINNTRKVLKEIIYKHNGIVVENLTTYYLDKVYLSLNLEEYKEHEINIKSMFENWKVGYSQNITEQMINSDSIPVLPECLLAEYKTYMDNKEYLKANSLFVNINYQRLKNHSYTYEKVEVVDYIYNNEIGLCYKTNKENKIV